MTVVGRVTAIWRYPIKSMMGEALPEAELGPLGIPGDRAWAIHDSVQLRGAKKFPALMQCRARYRREPDETATPVDVVLPDGAKTASDAPDVDRLLSGFLGTEVTLCARRPASDREHYRRREERTPEAAREALGREPDEPMPDFGIMPKELMDELRDYAAPLGTYFDAYPIHLVTTSWLGALAEHNPSSRFEAERFRPNLVIETSEPGLVELGWCGERVRIGSAELSCVVPTIRCSMTMHATGALPRDPQVLRTIVRETDQNVGIYATPDRPGLVRVGDSVEIA